MSLPNPSMSFSPFAILTAEEMNDLVANIESLADGTGFDTGAVGPESRSGGFHIGVIPGSELGTTGNKQVIGVGFKPKRVRFTVVPSSSTSVATQGSGSMDEDGSQFAQWISISSSDRVRNGHSNLCIAWGTAPSSSPQLACSFVSMDDDGFTINCSDSHAAFDIAYEACG